LQSDWGQRGAGRGFKLEGSKLKQAEKELKDVQKQILDLKKGGVQLDGYEQETLYKFAFPNRPPIRIPYKKPKDFQAQHENPAKYYDTNANVKDYDFDYSQSRMPEEFRTMTFGQYMNFYDTMGEYRKGELSDQSLKYRLDSIIDKNNSINKYFDDKDADFLFGQINQPRFNADGNKFMKELSKDYLKKLNQIQGGVPSAPFVTDRNKWTGLAIKRLLKLADEGGYDAIAFTPGEVQYDRWGKLSLVDYYNKIIPQVASKLPKSLGVTTEKINIPIPMDNPIGLSMASDGRYFVNNIGSDKPLDGKYFNTKEEADAYADMIEQRRTNQETFAINVTPKMQEKVRSGIPLFSATGGALGLGATMNNEDYGALSNMPSTQANAT
jgi:dsDNA-binding SOS-regulon protein